jgi:hypothetical protein
VSAPGWRVQEESLAIARISEPGDYLRDPVPVISLAAAHFTQRTTLCPGLQCLFHVR